MITLTRDTESPPLHIQIATIFRNRILGGEWPAGANIPPEKDLCAEFNVARGTIRQALHSLEEAGYLRREQGRGTFVEMDWQRSIAPNAKIGTGHLAFVVPYVRDSSVSTILVGFQQVAQSLDFSVIFHHVNNDFEEQSKVIRRLVRDGIDGVALYPVDSDHALPLDALAERHIPLVLIDRYLKGRATDYVMTDHFGGAVRGTDYLISRGHTRVGFVTWASPAVSMEHRFIGYRRAMEERGLLITPDDVCIVNGYPAFDLRPLIEFLSRPDRPTAIFAANDQIASAVYRAASIVGISIPTQLSVVGFDNLDLSPHLDPPLTTVAQPFIKIGSTAAEILHSRLRGERAGLQQITLSASLVERESVAVKL